MSKKSIVMFGSYVTDLTGMASHLPRPGETVFGDVFKMGPGGKGSNQTVAAHRAGADIKLITKLGQDMFADMALAFYKENGIDSSHVLIDEQESTGIALICVDESSKENQILVVPGACTNFTAEDMRIIRPHIEGADIMLSQFEINMDALHSGLDIAVGAGVTVVVNPAPARAVDAATLAKMDYITPNEIETEMLTGVKVTDESSARQAATVFQQMGVGGVAITLGSAGVFASDGEHSRMIPARKVDVVDTTGAGDAFNGGFVAALAEGADVIEASDFGNVVASLAVQAFGTAPSMPTRNAIDAVWRA